MTEPLLIKCFQLAYEDLLRKKLFRNPVDLAQKLNKGKSATYTYVKGDKAISTDFRDAFEKKFKLDIGDYREKAIEELSRMQQVPTYHSQDSIDWQQKYVTEVEENKKLLSERSDLVARIELLEKSDLAQNAKIWALEEFLLQLAAEVRRPDQNLAVTATDVDSQSVILGKLEGAALRKSLGKNTAGSESADKKGSVPGKAKVR